MIDHVKLFVPDLDRAVEFYLQALAPLGYERVRSFEKTDDVAAFGPDRPYFWLESRTDSPCTPTHVAFLAGDRPAVDAFHAAALEAGASDNGAPGPREELHPGYYGGFVIDADGNNVEAVCHTLPD